ncbi:hypothetical protein GQ600_9592 [Phytophthora cactorum]|nr:hypothetical protein GQ600_9592 [Phytophthora cactorum]
MAYHRRYSRPGTNRTPTCDKISEILGSADKLAGEYSFGGRADTLPPTPGLFVNGVGMILLPLVSEHAKKLIAKCRQSRDRPNMDMGKSWLQSDQVEMKNPSWQAGMEKLMKIIARGTGYMDIHFTACLTN